MNSPPSHRSRVAFTLIELLVVMAIIGLLTGLLLPVLNRAKAKAHSVVCLNHCKQLTTGYLMYAHDNNDLALSSLTSTQAPTPNWCEGWVADLPDAIDETLILQSPTYKYVASPKVFRCPSDPSAFMDRRKGMQPRSRSYSINSFMGQSLSPCVNCGPFKRMIRLSDITTPGPAEVYVIMDEHQNSINDSHFLPFSNLSLYGNQPWLDVPTGRHANAAGLAFADGHAEIHRWLDSDVQKVFPLPRRCPSEIGQPGPRDFAWFTNHIGPLK